MDQNHRCCRLHHGEMGNVWSGIPPPGSAVNTRYARHARHREETARNPPAASGSAVIEPYPPACRRASPTINTDQQDAVRGPICRWERGPRQRREPARGRSAWNDTPRCRVGCPQAGGLAGGHLSAPRTPGRSRAFRHERFRRPKCRTGFRRVNVFHAADETEIQRDLGPSGPIVDARCASVPNKRPHGLLSKTRRSACPKHKR